MKKIQAVAAQIPLVAWTTIALIPFVFITLLAFRDQKDIFAYPLGFGGDFTLENFAVAWNGPAGGAGLGVYFTNTLIVAVAGLIVNLGAGLPAAYFSTLLPERLRKIFLQLFLIGTIIPLILLVVPYFQIFDMLQLVSNPVALGVTYGVLSLPTTILVLHSFFVDFPAELTEAAAIDGLGRWASFWRIVVPLSIGPMVGVGLLALVFMWGEAQLGIVLLQAADSQTVPVGLLGFRGMFFTTLGPIFAGLALASLPIIIVYLFLHRHITKGIALGGVFR
ncbi:carbohydrate ABC transporter permease [Microbacterium aquimaris]|uniref:Carbohydrate ABC transporter permease n=1 Tax=Microbacterium aquimaris TaxID=459816 RepID=A0ABU5N2S2_9MICO|nr:carbohydrate ABC transporter permease [Microbacterium aquimaris]MDZ8160371.1 carbohydrate ABC transporter permease [Microbacterium aquimaris]